MLVLAIVTLLASSGLTQREYWLVQEDLQVSCSSDEWITAQLALGGPMLLLFVIGVPLVLLYQLCRHARKPALTTDRVRVVYGFLFLGYKPQYYFWEVR